MLLRMFVRRLHVSPNVRVRLVARTMPRTIADFQDGLTTPEKHEGQLVRIAFIGDPNVGKSTIINKLIARDICTVSSKAHTTREATPVALTTDDLQMVLVDTPGAVHRVHARKHHLPDAMVQAPKKALEERIDVLAAVIDCSDGYRREYFSFEMLELLHKHRVSQPDACSVLVLNKVDKLKRKRDLLSFIDSLCKGTVGKTPVRKRERNREVDLKAKIWEKEENRLASLALKERVENQNKAEVNEENSLILQRSEANPDPGTYKEEYPPRLESWPHFERVFIVSALKNDGIDDLREFVLSRAQKGVWKYRKDFLTKRNPVELAEDVVKSKLLEFVHHEIPYVVTPKVVGWSIDEAGSLHVDINILCKSEREVTIVLGKEARTIRDITDSSRQQMCNIFGCEVALKLVVVNRMPKAKK